MKFNSWLAFNTFKIFHCVLESCAKKHNYAELSSKLESHLRKPSRQLPKAEAIFGNLRNKSLSTDKKWKKCRLYNLKAICNNFAFYCKY